MRNLHTTLPELTRAAACTGACALTLTGAFGSVSGGALAGFLMLVVEEDLRDFRISNRLTVPAFGIVLLFATWTAGAEGLLTAVAGAATVLAVLWGPFYFRAMGAGDVKALMVVGALLGPLAVPGLLFWSIMAGGALCAATLILENGLAEMASRYRATLRLLVHSGRFHYFPPSDGSVAASGIPFGMAIASGVACQMIWGTPWTA